MDWLEARFPSINIVCLHSRPGGVCDHLLHKSFLHRRWATVINNWMTMTDLRAGVCASKWWICKEIPPFLADHSCFAHRAGTCGSTIRTPFYVRWLCCRATHGKRISTLPCFCSARWFFEWIDNKEKMICTVHSWDLNETARAHASRVNCLAGIAWCRTVDELMGKWLEC